MKDKDRTWETPTVRKLSIKQTFSGTDDNNTEAVNSDYVPS